MKYLIYELFSGVGFCNQLFSLETAIYLSNITNRKLILLIRNPLCHCGRASWDYGYFMDYFDNMYKEYLPEGIEIYYKNIPEKYENLIKNKECYKLKINNKFSGIVFVDTVFKNQKDDIHKFCSGRNLIYLDFDKINNEYMYIDKSNASRCFYNFYTTNERYKLMSDICYSLTFLNKSIISKYNNIKFDLSIHLRLGDMKHSINNINAGKNLQCNIVNINHIENIIKELNVKNIALMVDRKDTEIVKELKKKFNIKLTEDLVENIDNPVLNFLLQKNICENSNHFIGSLNSTVTNHIQYIFYINNKVSNLYTLDKTNIDNINTYSWVGYKFGCGIGWQEFFDDNILKLQTCKNHYVSCKLNYIKIIKEININPNRDKKIISFCLYGLNDTRNKKRHFDKGVYINYHYMKNHNYKDWILRVYIPHSEPSHIIEKIKEFGDIEIILVDTNICLRALRFLPNDDPNVKVWISRDLDSIINSREEKAVEDWLKNKNNKEIMIMSDNDQHKWTIAAGMFGKINNYNNNIAEYMVNSNIANTNKFENDSEIAENYFYKDNNYIQYYRAGKKLKNSVPFPDLSPIHCNCVGNISPIFKYYNDLQLENVYPFLSNECYINENDKFLYKPWESLYKNKNQTCFAIWKENDLIMTIDSKKENGLGTWKTLNGEGKKLLKLNNRIKIFWENIKYIDAYMPNKDNINVKHGDIWYTFTRNI